MSFTPFSQETDLAYSIQFPGPTETEVD